MNVRTTTMDESSRGILFGLLAYGSWGVLPLFFRALEPAGPLEILSQRIIWSSIFCMLIWAWKRDFSWLRDVFGNTPRLVTLGTAAYILALNWGVYIYAVSIDHVLESSLGYFINPLMLVVVGVVVLEERMNALQWSAIALGGLAVLVISLDYGRLPWIALTLAVSFTAYGYIKKRIGGNIGALQTMTVESLLLLPFAIGTLLYVKLHADDLTFFTEGPSHTLLIMALGAATMLPLSWFTAAATRLPLFMMGLLQFVAPVGQFLVAVFIFDEDVPAARWAGFALVWVALVLLTIDTLRRANARRRLRKSTFATP